MQKPRALVLLLPDADRRVLEMALFAGITPVEIAEETGFPADTIASRLRGPLSSLRNGAGDAANVPNIPDSSCLTSTIIQNFPPSACIHATLLCKWKSCPGSPTLCQESRHDLDRSREVDVSNAPDTLTRPSGSLQRTACNIFVGQVRFSFVDNREVHPLSVS